VDDVYCFGGNPLDRASKHRDDADWITVLLGDPETHLLALRDMKPFTRGTTLPALDWRQSAVARPDRRRRAAYLPRPRRRARALRDRCSRSGRRSRR
jgi:hypothetical protein